MFCLEPEVTVVILSVIENFIVDCVRAGIAEGVTVEMEAAVLKQKVAQVIMDTNVNLKTIAEKKPEVKFLVVRPLQRPGLVCRVLA